MPRRRRRRGPYELSPQEREARRERARQLHRDGRFRATPDDSAPSETFQRIGELAASLAPALGVPAEADDSDASSREALIRQVRATVDRLGEAVEQTRATEARGAELARLAEEASRTRLPTSPAQRADSTKDEPTIEPDEPPIERPPVKQPPAEEEPAPDPLAASVARAFGPRLSPRGASPWKSGASPGRRYV